MASVILCGPERKEEWNEFAAFAPGGDILQSYEWGELKGKGEWLPLRLALLDGARIVSGMSLLKRDLPIPGKSILYSPRGPLLREWTTERLSELLEAARDLARGQGAILVKMDPAQCDSALVKTLRSEGCVPAGGADGFGGTQPRCVMTLDLSPSEDELLANFKPKWRYNIRLSERKGVTINLKCEKSDLSAFYDLLKITAERDGFMIRNYEYFEAMWDLLVPNRMGKLFLACADGQAIAGAFCTLFGPVCCYNYGASSNEHRELMPNHLMQWTMIRWARDHGFSIYDFRGVSPQKTDAEHDKLAGLNRFKEGFGAEFVEYIGEFDLPLSRIYYPLWVKGLPMARNLLKKRKRSEDEKSEEA